MFRFLTVTTVALAAAAAVPLLDRASKSAAPVSAPSPAAGLSATATAADSLRRSVGPDEVTLQAGRDGHFRAVVEIQGRSLDALVDTGASTVALSHEDAHRVGFFPRPSDYTARIATANGVVRAAPVTLGEIRLGTIRLQNVPALVMPPGAMSEALLGMSFIRRLGRFDLQGTRLVLAP